MSAAVLSVVYPGLESYLPDFLASLSAQTDDKFTLYLINDSFLKSGATLEYERLDVRVMDASGSPASLRKLGIQWLAQEGAEIVVFADADDTFAKDRIEISKKVLERCDVVFNELILFGSKIDSPIPLLGNRFDEGYKVTPESLRSANCIGMSNSAMRMDISFGLEEIPDDIVPFDWALFSLIAHSGFNILFTKRTNTNYRQHENNQASPLELSDRQILTGVKVKKDHFRFLASHYVEYGALATRFVDLYSQLNADALFKQQYLLEVRSQSPAYPLWWESIRTPEELGL